jgi:hypothetical protein
MIDLCLVNPHSYVVSRRYTDGNTEHSGKALQGFGAGNADAFADCF